MGDYGDYPDDWEYDWKEEKAFQTLFREWRSSELGIKHEGESEGAVMVAFLDDMLSFLRDFNMHGKLDKSPEDKNTGGDKVCKALLSFYWLEPLPGQMPYEQVAKDIKIIRFLITMLGRLKSLMDEGELDKPTKD